MIIHCEPLDMQIDWEIVFNASGNHPLCKKCNGQVQDPEETPALPIDGKRKPRKRCECGRGFFPKSNRQRLCPPCGELGEKRRKAEWARKNRGKMSGRR